jgi:hypothetical protein
MAVIFQRAVRDEYKADSSDRRIRYTNNIHAQSLDARISCITLYFLIQLFVSTGCYADAVLDFAFCFSAVLAPFSQHKTGDENVKNGSKLTDGRL